MGAEANAIVEYPEGPVLLVEVKLGWHSQVIDQAAKSPTRFADKIDPSLYPDNIRVIITGRGLAFRRPDGAQVVPLVSLTRKQRRLAVAAVEHARPVQYPLRQRPCEALEAIPQALLAANADRKSVV